MSGLLSHSRICPHDSGPSRLWYFSLLIKYHESDIILCEGINGLYRVHRVTTLNITTIWRKTIVIFVSMHFRRGRQNLYIPLCASQQIASYFKCEWQGWLHFHNYAVFSFEAFGTTTQTNKPPKSYTIYVEAARCWVIDQHAGGNTARTVCTLGAPTQAQLDILVSAPR